MKKGEIRIRKLKASLANIALFISIFVVLFPLALPTVSANGPPTTWYVDDVAGSSGPGDPPEDFISIQDAIDWWEVEEGDIIFVYSGLYEELVEVDKTLNITGESRTNTTIQPPENDPGTVITISASWVNVTGFTRGFGLLSGLLF